MEGPHQTPYTLLRHSSTTWMNIKAVAEVAKKYPSDEGNCRGRNNQKHPNTMYIQNISKKREENTTQWSTTGAKINTTALQHTQTCHDGWELSRSSRSPPNRW